MTPSAPAGDGHTQEEQNPSRVVVKVLQISRATLQPAGASGDNTRSHLGAPLFFSPGGAQVGSAAPEELLKSLQCFR